MVGISGKENNELIFALENTRFYGYTTCVRELSQIIRTIYLIKEKTRDSFPYLFFWIESGGNNFGTERSERWGM